MSFLLDTSVISELVKPTPDDKVVEWMKRAATWGKLAGAAEARGERLSVIDGLIAATGIANDLIIATSNVGNFKRCGASCFNPWMQS